jgi:nicotinamide-nucleotide amidase
MADPRRILTAELLAVGSELTTGETRDSNGGELAGSLATAGVAVRRISALPDRLDLVTDAFREGFGNVDLIVSTGGLGPTPDDLTREAVAAAVGEVPAIDPEIEAWLRAMFARRGTPLPEVNLKQAWRIPSAISIPNENGTAPGWWVDRPDGRIAVLLPGPPREMRPMWSEWVLPRLRERGLGDGRVVRVLRTYGIGESAVVDLLGEPLFRAANPVVATYARADWLDLRISAVDEVDAAGLTVRPAADVVADAESAIRAALGGYVWAEGETTWAEIVASAAAARGIRFATTEAGSQGQLAALLADVPELARAVVELSTGNPEAADLPTGDELTAAARTVAREGGVPVGLALAVVAEPNQTLLRAAVTLPGEPDGGRHVLDLRLFAHGPHGRFRAAIAAAAHLVEGLRGTDGGGA